MPYNGSGTFSVVYTFIPNTTISSSQMNGQFTDIASGLTNCLTRDGQSIMVGQIKAANGTVALPAYTWGTDLDTGIYRIAANNIGVAVGGAKVVDVAAAGVGVTGTFSATGVTSVADGTVSLPGLAFTSDPNSGVYRIGADNIGVAVNGAKVLDVSTAGLAITGTLSTTGAFSPNSLSGTIGGTPTFSGVMTFSAAPVFSAGASLGTGTYSGNATFSGNTIFSSATGIAAKNTIKVFGSILANGTISASFGIASCNRTSNGAYDVTWSAAFADANYAVMFMPVSNDQRTATITTKAAGTVHVVFRTLDGTPSDPQSFSVMAAA